MLVKQIPSVPRSQTCSDQVAVGCRAHAYHTCLARVPCTGRQAEAWLKATRGPLGNSLSLEPRCGVAFTSYCAASGDETFPGPTVQAGPPLPPQCSWGVLSINCRCFSAPGRTAQTRRCFPTQTPLSVFRDTLHICRLPLSLQGVKILEEGGRFSEEDRRDLGSDTLSLYTAI